MIPADLIALGVAFYDTQRGYGAAEGYARHQAVAYMRRKADDCGDAMPFYEALADALAARAAAKWKAEHCLTCQRRLDVPGSVGSRNCGGDCLECMADAGDPDCAAALQGAA